MLITLLPKQILSDSACTETHPTGPIKEGYMRFLCDDKARTPIVKRWEDEYTFHTPNVVPAWLRAIERTIAD